MSKASKVSARAKAAKGSSKELAERDEASFSSLADLRSLYNELRTEAALAPQTSADVQRNSVNVKVEANRAPASSAKSFNPKEPLHTSCNKEYRPQQYKNTATRLGKHEVATELMQRFPASKANELTLSDQGSWLEQAKQSLSALAFRQRSARFAPRLSDDFEPLLSYYGDGSAYFCKSGVGSDIARKMQRGQLSIEASNNLHGMRLDEARHAIIEFIQEAVQQGVRCVRVIHGKGFGSVNQKPALKGKVYAWLAQLEEVLAFREASPREGGSGAAIILLRSMTRMTPYAD